MADDGLCNVRSWRRALALATCALGCGALDASRSVEARFSTVQESPREVSGGDDKATLVITFPSFSDPKRALMVVDANERSFLGEVVPFSYTVATLPPGKVHLLVGAPEADGVCASIEGEVTAGKVYAVNVGNLFAFAAIVAQPLERPRDLEEFEGILSLLSSRSTDRAEGAKAITNDWESYWRPCADSARETRESAAQTSRALIEEFKRTAELRPTYGVDVLHIAPPP